MDVWVRAGASTEPSEWSGIAHFLEHMIFKGTDQLAPGVFDQVIERHGGVSNAATSHDYAHFFITASNAHLQRTTPYLAELLLNAAIPDAEFGREREVVLAELYQAYDNPDWLGFQALVETLYNQHPYGRSVLGTEEALMQRSPADMRCFHRQYYQPENMTVVMVGDLGLEETLELVNTNFQGFAGRSKCPQPTQVTEAPPITEIRRQTLQLPRLEQSRLILGWVGPGVEQLPDAYGLDMLSVLLAEGRSSRLVRQLREERGLVEAVSSSFSLQRESSLFTISVWLDSQYLDRVEALIGECLAELLEGPIPQVELARCQRLLCNDYAFSTETPAQLAGLYGYYSTIAQAETALTYPQWVQTLQADDLCRIANHYLSPYHYAAVILEPA